MAKAFSEDSRVKIPALLHFTRLGYRYRSLKDIRPQLDLETNIARELLRDAMNRLNPGLDTTPLTDDEFQAILSELSDSLAADDLGKGFFGKLQQGIVCRGETMRLLDFDMSTKNDWSVVTELPCLVDKSTETGSFRPDITVLVNGLPLAFCEVKIPNNLKGMQAEYERMNKRTSNAKYRRFLNLTQLMVFSNNMEYDDTEAVPISGAFYATNGRGHLFFSHFREEDKDIYANVNELNPEDEDTILQDTNMAMLKGRADYAMNCNFMTPTNRILTSLFSKERFLWLLHYGLTYVEKVNDKGVMEIAKHLMRYQQFFGSQAIGRKVAALREQEKASAGKVCYMDERMDYNLEMVADLPQHKTQQLGEKRQARGGVIWHTQGSGKTELAFYNVKILADYYAAQQIVAKFYFIVDRLDLMQQAADEFRARGLNVVEIGTRAEFTKNIQSTSEQTLSGGLVMNVVNIQKFGDDAVTKAPDYNVNIQRVYFIDEVHRDYRADGSFLARLVASDRNAIMFGLTGTPLISKVRTKDLFGDYIHKYYYNQSIADGYTLRLIREGIKTEYRLQLNAVLDKLSDEVQKGLIQKKDLTCHENYVKPLVDYIEEDFIGSRLLLGDNTIGAMVVADSSQQAQAIHQELSARGTFRTALVLSTIGETKDELKEKRDAFKRGEVDILVVYNMLLTGFDAPRLKKLYLGRVIRDHSLLQCLTRVNRPYHQLRYGYVVDFADIRAAFDKTNQAYMAELQEELGDDFEQFSSIFKTPEEIGEDLRKIADKLFSFDTDNLENFQRQISAIENKGEVLDLRQTLALYKELYNLAQLFGYEELTASLDRDKIRTLYQLTEQRLQLLREKEALQNPEDMDSLIELAAHDIQFTFHKVSEGELSLADAFASKRRQTIGEFGRNQDRKDPEFLQLWEELRRILEGHDIQEMTVADMQEQDKKLEILRQKMHDLNAANARLTERYGGDIRYMRLHKNLTREGLITSPSLTFEFLQDMKAYMDDSLLHKETILTNEKFFLQTLWKEIKQDLGGKQPLTVDIVKAIGNEIKNEYI